MKQIEILIDEKPVLVYKLGLKKFAGLIKTLESLPELGKEIQAIYVQGDTEKTLMQKMLPVLPDLIIKFLPDFNKILKISTNLSDEDIETLGPGDVYEIVEAFLLINKFDLIFEKVKKFGAQPIKPVAKLQ